MRSSLVGDIDLLNSWAVSPSGCITHPPMSSSAPVPGPPRPLAPWQRNPHSAHWPLRRLSIAACWGISG